LYDISPDDPKKAAAVRRKASKFYYNAITQTLYADHKTESSSTAYQIKRQKKYSKKRMTECVELISLAQSLEIDSEDWGIIGQNDP